MCQKRHVSLHPGALQIIRSLKKGLRVVGWIGSPGDGSTRLMQSLLYRPAAPLCTLGALIWLPQPRVEGLGKASSAFDSIDFMRELCIEPLVMAEPSPSVHCARGPRVSI